MPYGENRAGVVGSGLVWVEAKMSRISDYSTIVMYVYNGKEGIALRDIRAE